MDDTFSFVISRIHSMVCDTVDGYRGFLIPLFRASPLLLLLMLLLLLQSLALR